MSILPSLLTNYVPLWNAATAEQARQKEGALPQIIPNLNSQPPDPGSIIGNNNLFSSREANMSNKEALTAIRNKAEALDNTLPVVQGNVSTQLAFTQTLSKIKDCMVIVLNAPSSSENPSLANSNVSINKKVGEFASGVIGGAGGTLTTGLTAIGVPENLGKTIGDGITTAVNNKEITSSSNEILNTSFYTEGDDGSKKLTIFLPLPKTIQDSHSHEIDSMSNNPLQGIVQGALALLGGSSEGSKGGGKKYSNTSGLGEFIGNNIKLATRKTLNPAVETLYRSPNPRTWQFNIDYSPTNKGESDNFIKIIEQLKQHSYPTKDLGGILYSFPGTLDFYFKINNERSEVLPYSLEKCFIRSIQLDYVGNSGGFYAHFKDGNPVSMIVSLEIVESRLLDRDILDTQLKSIQDADVGYDKQYSKGDLSRGG